MNKILVSIIFFYTLFMLTGCVKTEPPESAALPDATRTILALSFTATLTQTITKTWTITPVFTKGVKTIVILVHTATVTPTM
jgi:hypothetical protein